jgi:DNA-binding CsgD family transcriptional regulator
LGIEGKKKATPSISIDVVAMKHKVTSDQVAARVGGKIGIFDPLSSAVPTPLSALTDADFKAWTACLKRLPASPAGFEAWFTNSLREFLPFEAAFAGYGEVVAGNIRLSRVFMQGYSQAYMQQLALSFDVSQRTSIAWWLTHREPFCINPEAPQAWASPFEVQEIIDFGFERVSAHGVLDVLATRGSYFSFTGLKQLDPNWVKSALRLAVPTLHEQFIRYAAELPAQNAAASQHAALQKLGSLSDREREVVLLAAQGLAAKDIAQRLGTAEKTVRNQLSRIYAASETGVRSFIITFPTRNRRKPGSGLSLSHSPNQATPNFIASSPMITLGYCQKSSVKAA